jgi:hypothetical protein
MVVVGAVESPLITCVWVASLFPATSVERNLTVELWDTVNGAVYVCTVPLVAGSVPSVV